MRDRALGSTIRFDFNTHVFATGALVAPSSAFVAADFRIYKDGSATEKTTTNGVTVTSPFDSVVGTHKIEIDTGNATGDAAFWASGSVYRVVLNSAKTVDGQIISGIPVGEFSIEVQTADVRKFGGVAGTFFAGIPDAKVASIAANAITAASIAADAENDLAVALLDLTDGIETSLTLRQAIRLIVASSAGKLSGAATSTVTIRNLADSLNRIVATVDADGNRSAITTNLG